MGTRHPTSNIILLAIMAMAGVLAFADVTSACTTTESAAPARACCANRPSSGCGCCGKVETLPPSAGASRAHAAMAVPARPTYQTASPSCECRAEEPAVPSNRPAQRTTSERTEGRLTGETLATVSIKLRPSSGLRHDFFPNESLLKSPLYLRTSHLLI